MVQRSAAALLLVMGLAGLPAGQSSPVNTDWPQWRGPDRTGLSKETGLLAQWPAGDDAAERKLRLFNDRLIGLALDRLTAAS